MSSAKRIVMPSDIIVGVGHAARASCITTTKMTKTKKLSHIQIYAMCKKQQSHDMKNCEDRSHSLHMS